MLLALLGSKLSIYGSIAAAVVLVLMGFYRAGVRAQARAERLQFLERLRRDLAAKERIKNEIRDLPPDDVRSQLRTRWTRG